MARDKSKRPAMLPLYPADFFSDPKVASMDWIEQAIHMRLMACWWLEQRPGEPLEPMTLERAAAFLPATAAISASTSLAAAKRVLSLCWPAGRNARIEEEWSRALGLVEAARAKGKAGGLAKAANARTRAQEAEKADSASSSLAAAKQSPTGSGSGSGSGITGSLPSVENRRSRSAAATGGGGGKPRKGKPKPETVPIPPDLDTVPFREAWDLWARHRRAKGSWTVVAAERQLAKLATLGTERAIAAINHSVEQGYTGLFEPNAPPGAQTNGAPQLTAEQVRGTPEEQEQRRLARIEGDKRRELQRLAANNTPRRY